MRPEPAAVAPETVAPIEVRVSPSSVLRALVWGGAPAVLLLHAPGGDLDDWDGLPVAIARRIGLGVAAFDLPGHGLSDAVATGAGDLDETIGTLLSTPQLGTVRAVVAAGATAVALLSVAAGRPLAGVVCLAPRGWDVTAATLPRSPRVPKLFVETGGDAVELAATRRLATAVGGWSAVFAAGGQSDGIGDEAWLMAGPRSAQLRDQIAAFLHECLARDSATTDAGSP